MVSPLIEAVFRKDILAVEALLDSGFNVNVTLRGIEVESDHMSASIWVLMLIVDGAWLITDRRD